MKVPTKKRAKHGQVTSLLPSVKYMNQSMSRNGHSVKMRRDKDGFYFKKIHVLRKYSVLLRIREYIFRVYGGLEIQCSNIYALPWSISGPDEVCTMLVYNAIEHASTFMEFHEPRTGTLLPVRCGR